MRLWRFTRAPFADLSGQGAYLYGGRWNSSGRYMVYCAADAALAVLEVRVHLDLPFDLLPDDYVLMEIDAGELPIDLGSEVLHILAKHRNELHEKLRIYGHL